MRYVINYELVTWDRDPLLASFNARDGRKCISSCSSVTDEESSISSSDSFSSGMGDIDDSFTTLSRGVEVLPYQFEPEAEPDSPPEESHVPSEAGDTPHSRIGNTDW